MTEKEIAEIRRRYRKGRTGITRVLGCFVNEKKEIISEFDRSLGLMSEDDADAILDLFKKSMSGNLGRNLFEVAIEESENGEKDWLVDLRANELKDTESVKTLYSMIIDSYEFDGNYLILLAHDRADLFSYSSDGEKNESVESFPYIACCVCPVRAGRTTLSYSLPEKSFRSLSSDTVIARPELGFVYPVLEDHGANIHKALYYTKDLGNSHQSVSEILFNASLPMPAKEQKETFGDLIREAMDEDCSLRAVSSVYAQIDQVIAEYKEEKPEEPLVISKEDASDMLRYCGVDEEKVEIFTQKFDETFGENAEINPKNVAEPRMQIKTPEVTIKVAPGCGEFVETRVIDGVKYILVRADREVEVNGIDVNI